MKTNMYKHHDLVSVIKSELIYFHRGIDVTRVNNKDNTITLIASHDQTGPDGYQYIKGKKVMSHVGIAWLTHRRANPGPPRKQPKSIKPTTPRNQSGLNPHKDFTFSKFNN